MIIPARPGSSNSCAPDARPCCRAVNVNGSLTNRHSGRSRWPRCARCPFAAGPRRVKASLTGSASESGRRTETGVVRFENVGLRYGMGPEVLRDVSFDVPENSFQFLTGPSGSGKTTLLRLLFLSLRPTRGLITMFGQDVATLPKRGLAEMRRRVGIVLQDFRLLDHLTTPENIALPLRGPGH